MSDTSWDIMSDYGAGASSRTKVRITVGIVGGSIVVPISPSATVTTLQNEALHRAAALGLPIPTGNLVVRSGVGQHAILFDDDLIEECPDLPDANVLLGPANTLPAILNHRPSSLGTGGCIYVRWITPGKALDFPTLAAIPVDINPLHKSIDMHTLKQIALERVYTRGNESTTIANFEVDLFLTPCPLKTTDGSMTLQILACSGTLEKPLDVFIIPRNATWANIDDKPHLLWGFISSNRGITTFLTCLKVLMNEAHCKPTLFRRLLKVLFEVTHFPPALQALQVLANRNRFIPDAVLILASCFRELSLRMVPGCLVGGRVESVLEGSRQIFAWIFEQTGRSAEVLDDPLDGLVRAVVFEELREDSIDYMAAPDERVEIVEFTVGGSTPVKAVSNLQPSTFESSATTTPNNLDLHRVRVRAHVSCKEDLRLLAMAYWGSYEDVTNDYTYTLSDAADFESLLLAANRSPRFLMLSPEELTDRHAQGITICKEGYVSLYSINLGHFKSLSSQVENAITGVEALTGKLPFCHLGECVDADAKWKGTDPGRALLEAIQPVIQERKREGTWDVDNWELKDEITRPDNPSPDEAIVICFDLSVSMGSALDGKWVSNDSQNTFSRLGETKQVFRNFIARMMGYHLVNTHIGLVMFSCEQQIEIVTELSKVRRDFKTKLESATTKGNTALWDAIETAGDMLAEFKENNPTTRLRIIVLTDGQDDCSATHPAAVCKYLYDTNIVLDSLVIGTDETDDLFRISKHTGGYAFNPQSRLLFFQTFLLEPFLDISARPDIVRVPLPPFAVWHLSEPKVPDMQGLYDFPPCRPHELQSGNFISLGAASRFFTIRKSSALLGRQNGESSSRPLGVERLGLSSGKIFLEEMKHMIASPHRSIYVYVNESDMSFWKVVMTGPAESPYENGTFILFVHMTASYPQSAPTLRFITPILHPNITKHGRIYHQILSDGWKPSFHICDVLQNVFGLLTSPETDDAVDELANLKFWIDKETADAEIRKYVDKFAKKSRGELKEEFERR